MTSRAVFWPRTARPLKPAMVGLLLVGLPLAVGVGCLCGLGLVRSAVWVAVGSVMSFATLVRPEIGIYILALTVGLAPRAFEIGPYSISSTEMLAVWLSVCLLARLTVGRQRLIRTPLDKPMLAFVLLVTLLTVARDLTLRGAGAAPSSILVTGKNWVIYAFIYFLVVHSIANRRQIGTAIILLIGSATIAALVNYFVYLPHAQPHAPLPFGITRLADIRFGGVNTYGLFTMIIASLALAHAIHTPNKMSKLLIFVVVVCMFLPWRYTYSRTAFLLMGLAFTVLSYNWRRWLTPLTAAVVILLWYAIPVAYQYRVAQASPLRGTEFFYHYVIQRAHLPFLTSALTNPSLQTLWGSGLYPGWSMQDNIYVFLLRSSGVLCLGVFVWLLVAVGKMVMRSYRWEDDPWGKGLALGSLVSYILMVVAGMVMNSFLTPILATTFWVIIGLQASRFALQERTRVGLPSNPPTYGITQ